MSIHGGFLSTKGVPFGEVYTCERVCFTEGLPDDAFVKERCSYWGVPFKEGCPY